MDTKIDNTDNTVRSDDDENLIDIEIDHPTMNGDMEEGRITSSESTSSLRPLTFDDVDSTADSEQSNDTSSLHLDENDFNVMKTSNISNNDEPITLMKTPNSDTITNDDDDDDDILFQIVRSGSCQNKLVIRSSCCMVLMMLIDSIISVIHYAQQVFSSHEIKVEMYDAMSSMNTESKTSTIPTYPDSGICLSTSTNSSSGNGMMMSMSHNSSNNHFLWEELMLFQIGLIQNVMHGALLLASIMIVWYHGNVIWMYFVRNVALYMMITGYLFVCSDIYKVITSNDSNETYRIIRIILVSCFAISSSITFYYYERIAWNLRSLVTKSSSFFISPQDIHMVAATTSHGAKNPTTTPDTSFDDEDEAGIETQDTRNNPHQSSSSSSSTVKLSTESSGIMLLSPKQIRQSNVIRVGEVLSQISIIIFLIGTTIQWLQLNKTCEQYIDNMESSSMSMVMNGEDSMMMVMNNDTNDMSDHNDMVYNGPHRMMKEIFSSTTISSRFLEDVIDRMTTTSTDDDSSSSHNNAINDLHAYRMAFTMLSHQSFLLAMIQISTIYPTDLSCLILTITASLWRIIVAICNIFYINNQQHNIDHSIDIMSTRLSHSLIYTCIELIVMIPILIASITLFLDVSKLTPRILYYYIIRGKHYSQLDDVQNNNNHNFNQNNNNDISGSFTNKEEDVDRNSNLDHPKIECNNDGVMKTATPTTTTSSTTKTIIQRYSCTTLYEISYQSKYKYTYQQKISSQLFYIGSIMLFIEMTIENMLLLQQNFIGTNVTYDIYKWGIHITAIYVACSFMCTETPFIYHHTRLVLIFASAFGSFIGIWQLFTLLYNVNNNSTMMDVSIDHFVAILFGCRFVCGIMQTLGLIILKHIEPIATTKEISTSSLSTAKDDEDTIIITNHVAKDRNKSEDEIAMSASTTENLEVAWNHARNALWKCYIPSCMIYVIYVAAIGNCSDPMISPVIPLPVSDNDDGACIVSNTDLLLEQNWPGMELYFHFGIIIPIFTLIGLQRQIPVYKPSLLIAIYITGQLCFLLVCDIFIWDLIYQTNYWISLNAIDITRRILLIVWTLSCGYLSYRLYQFWKLRSW